MDWQVYGRIKICAMAVGKMFNFTLMQFTYENSTFCFCQDCKKDWIVQCTMCGQDYLHMRTDEHEICDSCMKEIFG